MKKNYYLLATLLMVAILVGCSKENNEPEPAPTPSFNGLYGLGVYGSDEETYTYNLMSIDPVTGTCTPVYTFPANDGDDFFMLNPMVIPGSAEIYGAQWDDDEDYGSYVAKLRCLNIVTGTLTTLIDMPNHDYEYLFGVMGDKLGMLRQPIDSPTQPVELFEINPQNGVLKLLASFTGLEIESDRPPFAYDASTGIIATIADVGGEMDRLCFLNSISETITVDQSLSGIDMYGVFPIGDKVAVLADGGDFADQIRTLDFVNKRVGEQIAILSSASIDICSFAYNSGEQKLYFIDETVEENNDGYGVSTYDLKSGKYSKLTDRDQVQIFGVVWIETPQK